MRTVAVTQARTGSTRLPGKVLKMINGISLLELHLNRISGSKLIDELIVATTSEPQDDAIVQITDRLGLKCYRGSVNDVLDRFYQALQGSTADYVVRLTSDCPLIDPKLIDKVVHHCVEHGLDYCSNVLDPHYPDGQDIEVFRFSALEKAWKEATLPSEREHVTPYIWKNSSYKGGTLFKSDNYQEDYSFGHLRMTVDAQKDLDVMRKIVESIGTDRTWLEYAKYLETNESVKKINENITRNEGYGKSLNQEK